LFFLTATVCLAVPHSGQARQTPRLGLTGSQFWPAIALAARSLLARRHHAGSGRFAHRSPSRCRSTGFPDLARWSGPPQRVAMGGL